MPEIAIVGWAGRFPGGVRTPADYWRLLVDGRDAVIDIPPDRWDVDRYYDPDPDAPGKMYIRQGGFLTESIFAFDAGFFGITPREAERMDPQQRLLLQLVWEALEDARATPGPFPGQRTGVFIGAFTMDNMGQQLSIHNRDQIMASTGVSTTMTMLSNRISHAFDLQGPSLTMDTACSSSLVALHLACQALHNRDCDVAICGGVNLMFRPEFAIVMCKGRYLSPDARCKAFDAAANGYARGEGAGVIVLKRAEDVGREPVYAFIAGTGVNQDGHTPGISVPDGPAQQALIATVCDRAGVAPGQIQYVEAHGTGTAVGDPIEMESLGTVLGAGRAADDPLWVGSVKTNIGHLEAAAGIASVIKAALCLQHRQIPPHLHLKTVNPQIDLERLRVHIPLHQVDLPTLEYAAVNAFGYGGTNAHAILRRAAPADSAPTPEPDRPRLFALSARDPDALRALAADHAAYLAAESALSTADYGYTTARLRDHHDHRLAVVADSRAQLIDRLKAAAEGDTAPFSSSGRASTGRRHPVAFVYSGMGAQSWGMGADLLAHDPHFRAAVDSVDALFAPLAGWSIRAAFETTTGRPMTEPQHAQPANFALQVGLTAAWAARGLRPDAVTGHSVGEIAAAWAAGVLSLPDAVRLVYHRSRLQQALVGAGAMLAVGLPAAAVDDLLADYAGQLTLAARNSPQSMVVAGDANAVDHLAARLAAADIFHRRLLVDVAYHSHHMRPLEADFCAALADLPAREPQLPFYSTVTGARIEGPTGAVDHWWRNNAQPVLFQPAIEQMAADGYDAFIEISPHPVLAGHVRLTLGEREGIAVGSLERGAPGRETLLAALGRLHIFGASVDWAQLHPRGQRIPLPRYPWRREHLWAESAASTQDRIGTVSHPLLGLRVAAPEPTWEAELSQHRLPYLYDHQIGTAAIFPAAGYLEMMLAHAPDSGAPIAQPVTLEDVHFQKMLPLTRARLARLTFSPATRTLHIYSADPGDPPEWIAHASARALARPYAVPRADLPALADLLAVRGPARDCAALYAGYARRDLYYGPAFQTIRALYPMHDGMLARLALGESEAGTEAAYHMHPALLDGGLQALLPLLGGADDDAATILPTRARQVRWYRPAPAEVWCLARAIPHGGGPATGDLVFYAPEGDIIAELIGCEFQMIDERRHEKLMARWFYRLDWEPVPPPAAERIAPASWLILAAHDDPTAAALDAHLSALGHRPTRAPHHTAPADLLAALDAPPDAILYCAGDDSAWADVPAPDHAAALTHCDRLLALIQALAERGIDSLQRFGILTEAVYALSPSETVTRFGGMGLIGLGRVIAHEHPALNPILVDLPAGGAVGGAESLAEVLLARSDETEYALRADGLSVRRLSAAPAAPPARRATTTAEPCVLRIDQPGALDNLYFAHTERRAPGPGEIEMRVHASALNFKDIMKALGLLPPRYLAQTFFGDGLGLECAGEVMRVGPGVTDFAPGDTVVSVEGNGCFRAYNTISTRFVVHKPPQISYAESVTFINFTTAYYALHDIARLQPGERVLIHSASGGVGLAAIQVARWIGADIYATAGSPAKRALLADLGVQHVSDSRSHRFVDDVLRWTDGAGVDVVLNALPDEFLQSSLNLLAPLGRFIELGKRDIIQNNPLPMAAFDRNLTFSTIDIDIMGLRRPGLVAQLMHTVHRLMVEGHFHPLPVTVYPAGEVVEAFRAMSQSQHTGKIAVDMFEQPVTISAAAGFRPRPDATYLVTGGLGGFGLATAEWLAAAGARHLALISRSGAASDEARAALDRLRAAGVTVHAAAVDVTQRDQIDALLKALAATMPPLRGVVHSAMVLDDTFLTTLTPDRLRAVVDPKALGAWHLHEATQHLPLDFFVLYSSLSAIIGNPRQANYVIANALLDGLAHYRRACGLPATSINWGSIGDVGVVARNPLVEQHLSRMGIQPLASHLAVRCLERVLGEDQTQAIIVDMDWGRWAAGSMIGTDAPMYSHFLAADGHHATNGAGPFYQRLKEIDPAARPAWLAHYLIERISAITRVPAARLHPDDRFDALGLDSLMTIELNSAIRQETGHEFSTMMLLQGPTIQQLAGALAEMIEV